MRRLLWAAAGLRRAAPRLRSCGLSLFTLGIKSSCSGRHTVAIVLFQSTPCGALPLNLKLRRLPAMLQDQANVSIWHTALRFVRNFAALALAINENSPINLFIMHNMTRYTGARSISSLLCQWLVELEQLFPTGLRFRKKE